MKTSIRAPFSGAVILFICLMTAATGRAQTSIQDRFASAGDVKLHYLIAGKGEPVILLHGYAQNSHMWRPLMVELAKTRLVIAPDLRGFGQSSKPNGATTRSPWPKTFTVWLRHSGSNKQVSSVTISD